VRYFVQVQFLECQNVELQIVDIKSLTKVQYFALT
jgi:hypothetical protein